MLRIKIAQRLKPFSHIPGTHCILPGTSVRMQVFPTRIIYEDLSEAAPQKVKEVEFERTGPVRDFTIQQDLEKGRILVWGHAQEGYFQFIEEGKHKDSLERLSFGSHKAQDIALIQRRRDFKEIFPIWFQLGQMVPPLSPKPFSGTLALLEDCQKALTSHHPETILEPFEKLYLAGFEGLFSPRLYDEQHQGLGVKLPNVASASPLWLLQKGYELIRSLFIHFSAETLSLLPALPSQLHAGRMLNIQLEGVGTLDLEWSKKEMRRAVIHCTQEAELSVKLKHQKSFRLNKIKRHSTGETLKLTPGVWQFDQFMH